MIQAWNHEANVTVLIKRDLSFFIIHNRTTSGNEFEDQRDVSKALKPIFIFKQCYNDVVER